MIIKHNEINAVVNLDTGNTALHEAAADGHVLDVVNLIEKYQADLELLNNNGETPLRVAINANKIDAVKALVESGAIVSGEDYTYALNAKKFTIATYIHPIVTKSAAFSSNRAAPPNPYKGMDITGLSLREIGQICGVQGRAIAETGSAFGGRG